MRFLGGLGYLAGLIPGFLAITGNLARGPWVLAGSVFMGGLCVADWLFLESKRPPPEHREWTPDLVLILHVIVNTLAIATLLYGAASPYRPRLRLNEAVLSTGLNAGISGIVVAHELIHRRGRRWRLAGRWNLLLVNYSHFYIEHVQGHHKQVGARHDPSTARLGEDVYRYLARSLPQQFISALRIESKRLSKTGRWPYGLGNSVVMTTSLQVLVALLIGVTLGNRALYAYLAQGAIAVLLLQMVSYLQHYGLVRIPGSRIEPAHSWQSDRISSRFLLLELPRHADHHCHSTRPYHRLLSHAEAPMLPHGLLGTIPVLLFPPIWFGVARRILDATQPEASQLRRDDAASVPATPHFSTDRVSMLDRREAATD